MRAELVDVAMLEHRRNPRSVLEGGSGVARFVMEWRTIHGDWTRLSDPQERLAAMAALHDAVGQFRAGMR